MNPCNFCGLEGLTQDAVAFCASCRKYLCGACVKSHGKFLPGHTLSHGTDMPKNNVFKAYKTCKIHVNQIMELYCDEHCCMFCKFCKPVEHNGCSVKTIIDVVKDRNVGQEFDSNFASLTELCNMIDEKRDDMQNELETYSERKEVMETKVRALQKGLNDIFVSYTKRLKTNERDDLEMMTLKLQSYRSFYQKIKDQLTSMKVLKTESCREALFIYTIRLKQLEKQYTDVIKKLETNANDDAMFVLKDQRLPGLIQELNDINGFEAGLESCNLATGGAVGDSQLRHSPRSEKLTVDQTSQTDVIFQDHYEPYEKEKEFSVGDGRAGKSGKTENYQTCETDDVEHGSSEEASEQPPERSFMDIKSFSLVKENTTIDLINVCFFEMFAFFEMVTLSYVQMTT